MNTIPDDVEEHLRLSFAHRTELGMLVWRQHSPGRQGQYYDYQQTIAIAHLMLRGWSFGDAAKMVDASFVIAVPYLRGYESCKVEVPYFVLRVGYSRLTDGTIWEVLGDVDFPNAWNVVEDETSDYGAVATRNLQRSTEPLFTRVGNLVTNGAIDDEGRFVGAAPSFEFIGKGERPYPELRRKESFNA